MLKNALPNDFRNRYLSPREWALVLNVPQKTVGRWITFWRKSADVEIRVCYEMQDEGQLWHPILKLHVEDVLLALPTVRMAVPVEMQQEILSRLDEWGGVNE